METIDIGKLRIDPSKSPAILDTTTWSPDAAARIVTERRAMFWEGLFARDPGADAAQEGCTIYAGSRASVHGDEIALASLPDGQDVFIQRGTYTEGSALGTPLCTLPCAGGLKIAAFSADMKTVHRFVHDIMPDKAPRAMGRVPRLGIGNRHTTAMWPAIFRAMESRGFAANAIQNSLRELNLLSDLKAGILPHENYLFGFGTISEGHTGSTFEGLVHAGIIAVLKDRTCPRFGADADHIAVKRGPGGLDRAKRVLDSAREFSFFTLDMSDILDYGALSHSASSDAVDKFESVVADSGMRRDLASFYRRRRKVGGICFSFDGTELVRFVAKYWKALDALDALCAHIKEVKGGGAADIELSVDENPPEFSTHECITSSQELAFLALEINRRHLPVTHIAPNFGVEKGVDYRGQDGLEGLESRVRELTRIASEYNLMTDCHSGDDLSQATRRVFGRASEGRINFKISPYLQLLFADVLYEVQPDLFRYWWDNVYRFVAHEGENGSTFARECLADFAADPRPTPGQKLFHYYCFVSVGQRDERGQFIVRERLYGDLSEQFRVEYGNRLTHYIEDVADDIYSRTA